MREGCYNKTVSRQDRSIWAQLTLRLHLETRGLDPHWPPGAATPAADR